MKKLFLLLFIIFSICSSVRSENFLSSQNVRTTAGLLSLGSGATALYVNSRIEKLNNDIAKAQLDLSVDEMSYEERTLKTRALNKMQWNRFKMRALFWFAILSLTGTGIALIKSYINYYKGTVLTVDNLEPNMAQAIRSLSGKASPEVFFLEANGMYQIEVEGVVRDEKGKPVHPEDVSSYFSSIDHETQACAWLAHEKEVPADAVKFIVFGKTRFSYIWAINKPVSDDKYKPNTIYTSGDHEISTPTDISSDFYTPSVMRTIISHFYKIPKDDFNLSNSIFLWKYTGPARITIPSTGLTYLPGVLYTIQGIPKFTYALNSGTNHQAKAYIMHRTGVDIGDIGTVKKWKYASERIMWQYTGERSEDFSSKLGTSLTPNMIYDTVTTFDSEHSYIVKYHTTKPALFSIAEDDFSEDEIKRHIKASIAQELSIQQDTVQDVHIIPHPKYDKLKTYTWVYRGDTMKGVFFNGRELTSGQQFYQHRR